MKLGDAFYTTVGVAAIVMIAAIVVLMGHFSPVQVQVRAESLWGALRSPNVEMLVSDAANGFLLCMIGVVSVIAVMVSLGVIAGLRDLGERLVALLRRSTDPLDTLKG